MSKARRFTAVLLGISLLAGLTFWQTYRAEAQIRKVGGQPADEGATSAITLPKNPRAQQVMNAARQLIAEKEWGQAVRALQSLLDLGEDAVVEVKGQTADGKPTWVSIRVQANAMLGEMPPEGLQHYEQQYGQFARARLAEAKQRGDVTILAEVATRYLHTEAGAEAAMLLGTRCLNRDEPLLAALFFDRLVKRQGPDKLSSWTLYMIALSFYRSGNKEDGDKTWGLLTRKLDREGGLTVGKQFFNMTALRSELDRPTEDDSQVLHQWPVFRGGVSRTEQAMGGPPFMESQWTVPTMPTRGDIKSWTETNINNAIRYLQDQRGQPILPAFFPIAVDSKVVYRTYDGVYALDLKKEGKLEWFQYTDGGVFSLLSDPAKKSYIDQWNQNYSQYGPIGVLFENSVTGTLSTDGTRVFLIDDLAVPPHPFLLRNFMFGGQPNFGQLTEAVHRNGLKAINLKTGKLVWELGGRFDKESPLAASFFLGPPLPLGGKLYVLTEKNSELRLACLEPKDSENNPCPPEIIWMQTLALTKDKIQFDFNRRLHASSLAYGNGILVCPTNAGAVLGVDLLSHSLVWAHSYREGPPPGGAVMNPGAGVIINARGQQQFNLNTEWRLGAPAVHEGRVVFTAPDASAIYCLNLSNGKEIWKNLRASDDLYFAGVFAGRAVVVGKNYVKAYKIMSDKGEEAWSINNIGVPSGQGAASDNVYYLPLKSGPDKEPEICAIDVVKGQVVARTKSRKKELPGNLVFYEGEVLSQTINSIASYPQVQKKLQMADDLIKKNPRDPAGLIERGELRLDNGNLAGAYEDFHLALECNPRPELLPKAREKLYETLTEMFQRDFNLAEKHLDEYKVLCQVPDKEEQRRRQANFLCLLAKGREQQGRLVDAFQAYLDFGAVTGTEELISVVDEPNTKARPEVWARGRIAAMLEKASSDQRQPLEAKLAAEWLALKDASDLDALRRFVDLFGSSVAVGRQARLHLAERLIDSARDPKADELRKAQLELLQLVVLKNIDPQVAGQAVEALARLMLRKGLLGDAAHYYRQLARDFPRVVIKDGKTGAELYSEITTDKRFLPFLEEHRQSWHGPFKVSEIYGNFQMQPSFTLDAVGSLVPFFHRHRLTLDLNVQQLRIIDQLNGQEHWKTPALPSLAYLQHGHPNMRTIYSVQGSVVVVNLGHMVYGFDPVDQKKLWEYNLYAPGTSQNPQVGQVHRDRDGNLMLLYQDGWTQKLGQAGMVEASYVCLLTRNGLVALDPIKGSVLWSKGDINSMRTIIFGDSQYVFPVEVNADGAVTSASRAVRAADGVSFPVAPFTEAYQHKIAASGRYLLVRDPNNEGAPVRLRAYDVLAGKDLWQKVFPAGTVAFKSESADLGGAVDPEGNVVVYDLAAQQEALRATVKKEHLDKIESAVVLADRDQLYLLLNKSLDPNINNGVWPNVYHGMRCLNVNGMVYAFDRAGGKMKWFNEVPNQMLVLEQFRDLPILLFTSRTNKWVQQGQNRMNMHVVAVKTIHKQTGKRLYDKELNPNVNNFHAVQADFQAGTVDLVSFNLKVRHVLESKEGTGTAAAAGGSGSAPSAGAVPANPFQLLPAVKDQAIREAVK